MYSFKDYKSGKTPLYLLPEEKIFYSDITKALYNAGIKDGDTLLIHSNMLSFGKPNFTNINVFMSILIDSFFEVIGKSGTLIMPTFSFSFTNGEKYSVEDSPSLVGALTNHFRKIPGVIRTHDPIHSCAIKGPNSKMLSKIKNDTFGNSSIYEHLHNINAKIATFGTKFADNCFFHFIEQKVNVPYRYNKKFKGEIIIDNNKQALSFNYFVRDLDNNVESDVSRFNNDLLMSKSLVKADLGRSSIFCIESKLFFDKGVDALSKDINYFLKPN